MAEMCPRDDTGRRQRMSLHFAGSCAAIVPTDELLQRRRALVCGYQGEKTTCRRSLVLQVRRNSQLLLLDLFRKCAVRHVCDKLPAERSSRTTECSSQRLKRAHCSSQQPRRAQAARKRRDQQLSLRNGSSSLQQAQASSGGAFHL